MISTAPTTLIPHLRCRNASDAVSFYEKAFGAQTSGLIKAPNGMVMHAELKVKEATLYLADDMMPHDGVENSLQVAGPRVTLYLRVDDCDSLFQQAVAAGCKVHMPLQNLFWGDRLGVLADPFGHNWEIATTIRAVKNDELQDSLSTVQVQRG